jgi:hypothetical protein
LCLNLIMIKTSFNLSFINWIEGFLESSSFFFLINGVASSFFNPSRGQR